jgi:Protein of unknown function (DUF2516)
MTAVSIGAPELVLLVLLLVVPVLWAVVDAALLPSDAWRASGKSQTMWIALLLGGLVLCGPIGLVLAIVYFVSIRPRVAQARSSPK